MSSDPRSGPPAPSARRRRPAHLSRLPRWRTTAAAVALATTVAAGVVALQAGTASAATVGVGTRAYDGAVVTAETVVDAQTLDLTVTSPAVRGTAKVRLLLPAHWTSQPAATWPTLWLLHGANPEVPDYQSWTAFTDVAAFLRTRDVLAVLPSGGPAGFFTAEWNFGLPGGVDWETFHTVELPQILSRGYRSSGRNVVAGLSIGGLGAIDYAARHPGLYRAAASYSGMLDTLYPGVSTYVETSRLRAGQSYYRLWGSPLLQRGVWQQHNPYALIPKLAGVPVFVSTGNGSRGPLDTSSTVDVIEPLANAVTTRWAAAAKAAGVPVTTDFYGPGTHSWPYWQREFTVSWPLLATGLGVPA